MALYFLVVGATWIVATDVVVDVLGRGNGASLAFQVGKGLAFIGLSTAAVYWLIARELRAARRAGTQAGEAVRRSAAFVRAVGDSLVAHLAVIDREGTIVAVNEAWRRFATANTPASDPEHFNAWVGRNYLTVCQNSAAAGCTQAGETAAGIRAVLAGERASYGIEYPCNSPDEPRWFLLSVTPLQMDGGGAVLSHQDITARRQMEDELRANVQRFRQLADVVPGFVWTNRTDGSVTFLSRRWQEYTGSATSGPDDLRRMIPPDDLDRIISVWQEAARTGQAYQCEFRLRRAEDGVYRWFFSRCVPPQADEPAGLWVGVTIDIDDLKRAEQSLRESEARFQLLADNIQDVFHIRDLVQNRLLYLSPAFDQVWHFSRAEVMGRPDRFPEFLHPDDRVRMAAALQRQHQQPHAEAIEYRIVRPDGTVRWILDRVWPVPDERGDPHLLVGIAQDVTERKRAEERLQLALAASHMGVWEWDIRTDVVHWSEECFAIFRPVRPCTTLAEFLQLVHPADRGGFTTDFRPQGGSSSLETVVRVVRGDGEVRWVQNLARPEYDAAGEPVRLVGTVRDVTAEKQAEIALRESQDRYRQLLDVLPTPVFLHTDDRIVFCNPAAIRLMGASAADDLLGRAYTDVAHPDYRDLVLQRLAVMRQTGQPVPPVEMRIVRLDGRPVSVYSVSTPLVDGGQPAFLVALSDLTERERAAEVLRSVLGSVADVIITIDEQGRIQSVNPAVERTLGYPPGELIGQNVGMLMPEPHRSAHDDYLQAYRRTGVPRIIGIGRALEAVRKNGTRLPVELTVTEFRLGEERQFTGVIRDLSERRQLEAQFQQAQK
ncbi:MAG: PAS domain S-box protein, partial [Gemmataceae bacterium]